MKNQIRTVLGASLVLGALFIAPLAKADVGSIDFAITNKVAANATTSVNLGNSALIENQDNCSFEFRFQGDAAGTGALTITFARSWDNVTFETAPRFTWAPVLNGTTAVVSWTNFSSSFIGAARYVKVVSIANADATANATNCVLRLVKKTIKASP